MEHYINLNSIKLWTDIRGVATGRFIVLCSGGPGCCDYLLPVSQMLEDKYTVIRFEQRGCGRSDKEGPYDLETAIHDLEEIRKYYGIDTWVIGGHSWGANLALIYAMSYPKRVDAILYIAGNGLQHNMEWSMEYHANREKFGEKMPAMEYPPNDDVNKAGNSSYKQFIQKPALFQNISRLRMKALFICAANDIRPNWPSQQLQALMANAQIKFIDDAAHYIWLFQRDTLKEVLNDFLEEVYPES